MVASDFDRLMADRERLMADRERLIGRNGEAIDISSYGPRLIEGRTEPPKPIPKPDTTDDDHARALLKLHSARRLLRTYRLGLCGLLSGAVVGAVMGLGGIGVAIASSVLGYDAGTVVLNLEVGGWPGLVASVVGLFVWQAIYRIDARYTGDNYTRVRAMDSIKYVDPQLNLEIRQLEYSRALEALAHKGMTE